MDNKYYSKVYREVIEYLRHLNKEDFEKIPKELISFFENNMDKDYDYKLLMPIRYMGSNTIGSYLSPILKNGCELAKEQYKFSKENLNVKSLTNFEALNNCQVGECKPIFARIKE